jgi:hypothetical protein
MTENHDQVKSSRSISRMKSDPLLKSKYGSNFAIRKVLNNHDPIKAHIPNAYTYLRHLEEERRAIVGKSINDHQFPLSKQKSRIQVKFKATPFPHMEREFVPLPNPILDHCIKNSEKRREAYPVMGKAKVREGVIPTILDPAYSEYEASVQENVQQTLIKSAKSAKSIKSHIMLPLPSMLKKPIGRAEYIERLYSLEKRESSISSSKSNPSFKEDLAFLPSDYIPRSVSPVFFQHVRQPDFSDFEQRLLIQKPVIIYMAQKVIRKVNPGPLFISKLG